VNNFRSTALLLILVVEVFISVATKLDVMQAGGVTATIVIVSIPIFIRWCITPSFFVNGYAISFLGSLVILSIVGFWGLLIALLHANNLYYVFGDAYHWFIELIFLAVFSYMVLGRNKPTEIAVIIGFYGVVLGLAGLLTYLLAIKGIFSGAHLVPAVGIWRFDTIRAFPEYILIPVTAALFFAKPRKAWMRFLLWTALILLLANLAITLKRTLWVSYFFAIFILMMPRFTTVMMIIGALLSLIVLSFYSVDARFMAESFEFLTYNPNNTDSFSGRFAQLASLIPYVVENPIGYGFGSTFYMFSPGDDTYRFIHHIHSIYVAYLLHFGIIGVFFVIAVFLWLAWQYWRFLGYYSEWNWLLRTSLANLCAIALNGLMLMSTHTVFAGFSIGLGIIALTQIRTTSGDL